MTIQQFILTLHYGKDNYKPRNISIGRWNAMKSWVNKRLSEGFKPEYLQFLNFPHYDDDES